MSFRAKSELHCLEKSEWQEVLQKRGDNKGKPPAVHKSGMVFVGYRVEEVRVFKKIEVK